MASKSQKEVIPATVQRYFSTESAKVTSSSEWRSLVRASDSLYRAAIDAKTFDPRFNAVHWAFDVYSLCQQIAYGYCWFNAYAKFYMETHPPGSEPAHVNFQVTYFADNCITRIDSCRDKLALLAWAFYCPFNPENRNEVLDYLSILERLKYPVRFALRLKRPCDFIEALNLLKGEDFAKIETYRNLKIHRLEPRIEIYEVAKHHGWSYLIPLIKPKDVTEWERELEDNYQEPEFRERIKKICYIGGVLFGHKHIENQRWGFNDVQRHIRSCLFKLLRASDKSIRILKRRLPSGKLARSIRRT